MLEELAAKRNERYRRRARRLLLSLVLDGRTVTADDFSRIAIPTDVDRRFLGGVPHPLAKAGLIRIVGFVMSRRPERNASRLAVWELSDRHGAEQWLENHPDWPDPVNIDERGNRLLFSTGAGPPDEKSSMAGTIEREQEA